jgi:ABC-type nickel/cobalt efflux system permease component RcnA
VEWSGEVATVAAAKKREPVIAPIPQPAVVKHDKDESPVPGQPEAPGAVVRGDYLSRMLHNRDLTLGMMLIGIAVAFGLGAAHALSPGHGKTIVAAYLVGARGTARHAMFLGGMVTFTHTISVFGLAFTVLYLRQYVAPDKISPVLEVIASVSIVWIGAMLLFKRIRALRGHSHSHDGHDHHHHDHSHGHDHDHGPHGHSHVPEGDVTLGSLIALGASGGLVPCPSGLLLLLGAIRLDRIGLGIVLLVAFSLGLAAVLAGIGLMVIYAKDFLPDSAKANAHPVFRLVPVISAGVVLCIGLVMTGISLGVIKGPGA